MHSNKEDNQFKYFPILFSKSAELDALSNLDLGIKRGIVPVIVVLEKNLPELESMLKNHWNFTGNQVLLDFSSYNDIRQPLLRLFFERLFGAGVNAVPVVHRNRSLFFLEFLKQLIIDFRCKICIRSSNHTGTFIEYDEQVNSILNILEISRYKTILLLDIGYIQPHNYNIMNSFVTGLLDKITYFTNYAEIIVSAGSFPDDIAGSNSKNGIRIERFELELFKEIHKENKFQTIKYGDYGIKNPQTVNSDQAGELSIKYTSKNNFLVYSLKRSEDADNAKIYYPALSRQLTTSSEYSGENFSWGDSEIFRIANHMDSQKQKGKINSTVLDRLSQNHHLTLMHGLL